MQRPVEDIDNNPFLLTPKKHKSDRYISPLSERLLERPLESGFPSPLLTPLSQKTKRLFTDYTPQKSLQHSYTDLERTRIINTPTKAGKFPLAFQDSLPKVEKRPQKRKIPKQPSMVLDAPGARDDYYIDPLDWSSNGSLLVGLGNKAYIWRQDAPVKDLYTIDEPDYISVTRTLDDQYAIATNAGHLSIFRSENLFEYRKLDGICSMSWIGQNELAIGNKLGHVLRLDYRAPGTILFPECHLDKIVGMKMCPDGIHLATGGNGHIVKVWDLRKNTLPVHQFLSHGSAVRAMDFCPWQPSVLLTGGGREDGQLCFHDILTGKLLKTIETVDQVCQVKFSVHYKEVLTCHARPKDQLTLWDVSKLEKARQIVALEGHQSRPMFVALSPDGQTATTMGGDEVLKFWKMFEVGQKYQTLYPTIR